MLRREEELRLCADTQVAFSKVRSKEDGVLQIIEDLQRRVAAEFGLPEKEGLIMLRSAERWLGDEKARELSFYRRHRERCRDGPLQVGDVAPFSCVPLLPLVAMGSCGASVVQDSLDLSILGKVDSPLVLIAGSHS